MAMMRMSVRGAVLHHMFAPSAPSGRADEGGVQAATRRNSAKPPGAIRHTRRASLGRFRRTGRGAGEGALADLERLADAGVQHPRPLGLHVNEPLVRREVFGQPK